MKASRFTEEQIVRALKEVEAGGKTAVAQQRELGISNATWYIWKCKYGGLEVNEASVYGTSFQENLLSLAIFKGDIVEQLGLKTGDKPTVIIKRITR